MSKVIKVEEKVYDELDKQRAGRQTFSDVIESLLLSRLRILEMMSVLEVQIKFREWQRQQLEEKLAEEEKRHV